MPDFQVRVEAVEEFNVLIKDAVDADEAEDLAEVAVMNGTVSSSSHQLRVDFAEEVEK